MIAETIYATVTRAPQMAASQRAEACCRKNGRLLGMRKPVLRFANICCLAGTQIC